MISFLRFVMYWWPSFLVILSCAWILLNVNTKESRNTQNIVNNVDMPQVRPRGKVTVWISTPMVLALGIAAGYAIRDHQLASNIVPYTHVLILPPSQPDTDFDIQPARMQPIPSKLCYSQVDWKLGETLKDLLFEQKQGCKRIISYHRYEKGEVINASERILQIR